MQLPLISHLQPTKCRCTAVKYRQTCGWMSPIRRLPGSSSAHVTYNCARMYYSGAHDHPRGRGQRRGAPRHWTVREWDTTARPPGIYLGIRRGNGEFATGQGGDRYRDHPPAGHVASAPAKSGGRTRRHRRVPTGQLGSPTAGAAPSREVAGGARGTRAAPDLRPDGPHLREAGAAHRLLTRRLPRGAVQRIPHSARQSSAGIIRTDPPDRTGAVRRRSGNDIRNIRRAPLRLCVHSPGAPRHLEDR